MSMYEDLTRSDDPRRQLAKAIARRKQQRPMPKYPSDNAGLSRQGTPRVPKLGVGKQRRRYLTGD